MGCVFFLFSMFYCGGFSSRFAIIHDLVFFFFFLFQFRIFDARIIILLPSVILFEMRLVAKGVHGVIFFSTFHGICLDGAAVSLNLFF